MRPMERCKDLEKSHPVETSECAVAQEIDQEPSFNWWVKAVLKKRLNITSLLKKRNARYLNKKISLGLRFLSQLHRNML